MVISVVKVFLFFYSISYCNKDRHMIYREYISKRYTPLRPGARPEKRVGIIYYKGETLWYGC